MDNLGTQRLSYSVVEAAAVTGLSRSTLYAEMKAGRLPYVKVGARRLLTRDGLTDFLSDLSEPRAS